MATTRVFPLHENLLGGVDTTLPAHLLKPDQWRTQHNFRNTPTLTQIPHKVLLTSGLGDLRWIGIIPGATQGFGDAVALTPTKVLQKSLATWATLAPTFVDDGTFRRWSVALYNSSLYFVNDLNPVTAYNGGVVAGVTNAPRGRYLCFWFDHLVIGAPNGNINQLLWSHLYDFTNFTPSPTNESDLYDFVEDQQPDYPFTGITGLGKLRGMLFVYTPTAIYPLQYVGLPKVIRVVDEGTITRTGNTFPWTLVCLDNVHFFYDHNASMFFAFDGQTVHPVGEPIKAFIAANLHPDLATAQKMYGYIDNDNDEIWWPFVSKAHAENGPFDKAVVFNFRYKKWSTASVENVQCFCGGSRTTSTISSLAGTIAGLGSTPIGQLGLDSVGLDRTYGTGTGELLRDELPEDTTFETPYDFPVLETPDFHYGDIRTVKEVDAMILNSTAPTIEVRATGRNFLGATPSYPTDALAVWKPTYPDAMVNFKALSGRILRFMFTFINTRNVTFDAYSEGILTEKAEK